MVCTVRMLASMFISGSDMSMMIVAWEPPSSVISSAFSQTLQKQTDGLSQQPDGNCKNSLMFHLLLKGLVSP